MIIYYCFGGVAQLGERLNGIQEVNGSIPSVSTILIIKGYINRCALLLLLIESGEGRDRRRMCQAVSSAHGADKNDSVNHF